MLPLVKRMEIEKLKRLSSWIGGRPSGPIKLHFNPTHRCNLRCRFCWLSNVDYDSQLKELSDSEMDRVFNEAAQLGVMEWLISGGGEPMVRPSTLHLVEKIKSSGQFGDLITNGILFTEEVIKRFVSIKWDRIQFSLDAPSAETHNDLRGRDFAFDSVVRAVKGFACWKGKMHSDKPVIAVGTVLTNRIHLQICEFIELLDDIGCNEWRLNPLKRYNSECEDMLLRPGEELEFQKHLPDAIRLAEKYNMDTNLRDFVRTNIVISSDNMVPVLSEECRNSSTVDWPCFEPWTTIVMDADGSIGCCCERQGELEKEYFKRESLHDIWYGPYFSEARKNISEKVFSDKCSKCGLWQVAKTRKTRKGLNELAE